MTNRQWLIWQMIDMPDKELFNKYHGFICDVCGNNNIFPDNAPCPHKCEQKVFDWLGQEHKDESKTE